MIPDAAGLALRGVCSFSINFYRFATPRAPPTFFVCWYMSYKNTSSQKIPAAVLTVDQVQEDSI